MIVRGNVENIGREVGYFKELWFIMCNLLFSFSFGALMYLLLDKNRAKPKKSY